MVKLEMSGRIPGGIALYLVQSALLRVDMRATAYLTGGCLRDAWHGVPHKDVDIAIVNLPVAFMAGRLQHELEAIGFTPRTTRDKEELAPSDSDEVRVQYVKSYVYSATGEVVDILVYAPSFCTLRDVLLSHDHNINMFGGQIEDDGTIGVYYPWHYMGHCYRMREQVSESRIEYIQHVAARLGWGYHAYRPVVKHPHLNMPRPPAAVGATWQWTDHQGNKGLTNILT